MVALPTPARAATASIEISSASVPSASRSSTASMIASSARALRGRPGDWRSWSAGTASGIVVVTPHIVPARSLLGQFQLLPECLDRLRVRRKYHRTAGQPDQYDRQADQRHDHGTEGGGVHRVDERGV